MENSMTLHFDARPVNEGFARMAVAAFVMKMNPTVECLEDIRTAVSEAVTNAIVHGYSREQEQVEIDCRIEGSRVTIDVVDHGIGIEDVSRAMEPFYTSKPQLDRSGMGFSFMEAFMDELIVDSELGKGTRVRMIKYIDGGDAD